MSTNIPCLCSELIVCLMRGGKVNLGATIGCGCEHQWLFENNVANELKLISAHFDLIKEREQRPHSQELCEASNSNQLRHFTISAETYLLRLRIYTIDLVETELLRHVSRHWTENVESRGKEDLILSSLMAVNMFQKFPNVYIGQYLCGAY